MKINFSFLFEIILSISFPSPFSLQILPYQPSASLSNSWHLLISCCYVQIRIHTNVSKYNLLSLDNVTRMHAFGAGQSKPTTGVLFPGEDHSSYSVFFVTWSSLCMVETLWFTPNPSTQSSDLVYFDMSTVNVLSHLNGHASESRGL